MALIMYFTRAPRYKNTTIKEIQLIESYLRWQHEKEIGSRYGSDTFEKWNGHSESELPDKDAIEYYKSFLTQKKMHVEGIGEVECRSIFEQLARIVKANQIFNWFIKNVMNNKIDKDYYEVTKEQLKDFLNTCNRVKDSFVFLKKNEYTNKNEYTVNKEVAKELLPLMEEKGYFFGSSEYNALYADQVIKAINTVNNILTTTNFENQTIYFNARW